LGAPCTSPSGGRAGVPWEGFSAVNESVWEHLKLSFWPALPHSLLEHRHLRGRTGRFLPAKAVGIC